MARLAGVRARSLSRSAGGRLNGLKRHKRALGDRFNLEKGMSIMVHSRPMRTVILVTCLVLGFAIAAGGDQAQAENNLDASYTISFARVRVGDITASLVLGDTAYKISARGRAWGPGILTVGARKPLSRPQEICVRLTTPGHPLPTAAMNWRL